MKLFSSSLKRKSITNSLVPSYIQSLTTCDTINKDRMEYVFTSLKTSNKKDKIFEFITEINLPKEYGNNLIDNGFDNLDVLIIQTKNGIALTYEIGNPKLMAVFIDDLNMQKLDICLTQNAIELVRQFMDYKHIYECQKMELMEFLNIQFIASMNPTAGSFNINPRLQCHFWICSIPFPSDDSIRTIFQFFLDGHLRQFPANIQELSKGLVAGIIKLHKCVYA